MIWEYFEEGRNIVATMKKEDGTPLLDVCDAGEKGHYTIPKYAFIQSYFVPYQLEEIEGARTMKTMSVKKRRLQIACEKIQQNYEEQVSLIRKIIEEGQ